MLPSSGSPWALELKGGCEGHGYPNCNWARALRKKGFSLREMSHGIYNDHSWPRPPRTRSCQDSPCGSAELPRHRAGASHRCGVRRGPPIAIVESPRPGPSWNTASSVGHLTSAGMDKFWRRSREELLIDMEGLSYVDRLKSLSPFSLERRRRRLRGIFAVCEHLKGDHKDSGQDLIRLSSNRKQPPETPGGVPPNPEVSVGSA